MGDWQEHFSIELVKMSASKVPEPPAELIGPMDATYGLFIRNKTWNFQEADTRDLLETLCEFANSPRDAVAMIMFFASNKRGAELGEPGAYGGGDMVGLVMPFKLH